MIKKRVEYLNYQIFKWINQLALKKRHLDSIMIFSSKVLPYLIALFICAVFLYGVLRHNAISRKNVYWIAYCPEPCGKLPDWMPCLCSKAFRQP